MKLTRTDDPNIDYLETEGVTHWVNNIVRIKIDRSDRKFIVTAIMRNGDELNSLDVTGMYEQYLRGQL